MMSLPAMSLGLGFCVSWTGGGGWVHLKAVSGLACRKVLVGNGKAISVLFGIDGLRNKLSCRASVSRSYSPFFSYARLAFPKNLD